MKKLHNSPPATTGPILRKTNLLKSGTAEQKSPRMKPMREEVLVSKRLYQKTIAIDSKLGCGHDLFIHFPKEPSCKIRKMTKTTETRCGTSARRPDGLQAAKEFGHFTTADHQVFHVENELRHSHKLRNV